jgi:predicted nucleic acid-binding protein
MILLDTNLVSEPWRPQPDPHIVAWLDAQAVETLYLSAIIMADGYIAAIAAARDLSAASRDIAPFHAAGIPVINPRATVV